MWWSLFYKINKSYCINIITLYHSKCIIKFTFIQHGDQVMHIPLMLKENTHCWRLRFTWHKTKSGQFFILSIIIKKFGLNFCFCLFCLNQTSCLIGLWEKQRNIESKQKYDKSQSVTVMLVRPDSLPLRTSISRASHLFMQS